nr:TRAP transporter large permease subunit [Halomonas lutea]
MAGLVRHSGGDQFADQFPDPPFGYALFYLKGITEGQISIGTIYRSIIPFVVLQLTGLALCIAFPALVLWLPGLL